MKTATATLPTKVKADIINLQNWIEAQSWKLPTRNLYVVHDAYNYNELLENSESEVKLNFSYRGRLGDRQMTLTIASYAKVKEILAAIKSNQFSNEDIYRKILRKFS